MSLIWENLYFRSEERFLKKITRLCCCCCCKPREDGYILHNVNGVIAPGTIVALMGPSGAGKSTIVKCLTLGKAHRGYCKGEIMVQRARAGAETNGNGTATTNGNGHAGGHADAEEANKAAVASYICQDDQDHLLFTLTVEESLMYSSQLKNPAGTNHDAIITEQIEQLGLGRIRTSLVSKISGGERKRLAVGLELTSDPKPNYLFLDEPTSGLDSLAVLDLLQTLSSLVRGKPMAVITVIHQPSYDALQKFDQVYFLSKSGDMIYGGGPGPDLVQYITDHEYYTTTHTTPGYENPADIMIRIAASVSRRRSGNRAVARSLTRVQDDVESQRGEQTPLQKVCQAMTNAYRGSYLLARGDPTKLRLVEIQNDGLCNNKSRFSLNNLWVLLRRTARSTILGQPQFLMIRLMLHAVVALTLALLYNRQIGTEDSCYTVDPRFDKRNCTCSLHEEELRHESVSGQNVKFQFFSLLFLMFAALMPTVLSYPAEIKVFLNEYRNGWYTTGTYYVAKTLTEIPFQLIFSCLYVWFLYWYTQQIGIDTWRYGMFLTITVLACFIAQGLGFLIGILCVNSSNIAIILSSSVLLFLFLFSGFFVKTAAMGPYVSYITYLSFIKFAFEGLLILIYGFERCGLIPLPGSIAPSVPTKSAILYTFNIHDEDLWTNLYWLIGHLIVVRAIAFILLKTRADPRFLRPSNFVKNTINWLLDVCSDFYFRTGRCCRISHVSNAGFMELEPWLPDSEAAEA